MANTKSAQKNIRKTERQTERNRFIKSRIKTLAKKVTAASASGDSAVAKQAAIDYVSALDKAAKSGIIHDNKAGRHKAQMAALIAAKA